MRVFITGGRGYVGGRLTEHLVKNGYEVFVGTRRKVGQDRLFYGAQLIQTNLFDDNFLSRIDKKFDGIVHCAAMNAIECSTDPLEAIKVNGLGTAHLVRSAKKHGVKKFIHLSTTHVYSDDPEGMIDEDTPAQNLHPYASSHLAGEFQTLYGGLDGRMETIVLRLSNGVGAPIQQNIDCWSLVVNDFCRQAVTANSGR